MDSLISRQAAIDALKGLPTWWADEGGYYGGAQPPMVALLDPEDAVSAIENLPPAQPKPQWIPVSEGLPEYMESVLTWDGVTYCVEKRIRCIRDEEGDPIEGDWWVSDEYDDIESDYYPDLRDGAAIAWMPLPEPYRAERRTNE